MSIGKNNFSVKSNLLHTQRRSYTLVDGGLADPNNDAPLVDGEWVALNGEGKIDRAVVLGAGDGLTKYTGSVALVHPVLDEKGRTDNQASGDRKKTVIALGPWEAETAVFAGSPADGDTLEIANIAVDGVLCAGLQTTTTGTPVAVVLRTLSNGKLLIRGGVPL